MMIEQVVSKGTVAIIIEDREGHIEKLSYPNTILRTGRNALAASLANQYGDQYDFFVSRMIFGENGTDGGVPKFVNTNRNGLFGITLLTKGVISTVDPNIPSQVTFTSILAFDECNGHSLSEMALRMNNGDLYSMVTFPDLGKTSNIQITFNWIIVYV
jgi:hypothetical protein